MLISKPITMVLYLYCTSMTETTIELAGATSTRKRWQHWIFAAHVFPTINPQN
jgi:hypothetical protein